MQKYRKNAAFTRIFFEKFAWTFAPLSCDTSQETHGKCSEKKCSDELFYFGWIFSGDFQKKNWAAVKGGAKKGVKFKRCFRGFPSRGCKFWGRKGSFCCIKKRVRRTIKMKWNCAPLRATPWREILWFCVCSRFSAFASVYLRSFSEPKAPCGTKNTTGSKSLQQRQ